MSTNPIAPANAANPNPGIKPPSPSSSTPRRRPSPSHQPQLLPLARFVLFILLPRYQDTTSTAITNATGSRVAPKPGLSSSSLIWLFSIMQLLESLREMPLNLLSSLGEHFSANPLPLTRASLNEWKRQT